MSRAERVEAAASGWLSTIPRGDGTFTVRAATAALAASDALLRTDEAVEGAARASYAEGAWCGECEFAGWDSCPDCRSCCITIARAVITALLGEGE